MNVKITAPYPRFRIGHMKFNSNGQRYCNLDDVKFLKRLDPTIGIFKDADGNELNPKPKKKKVKKEAPDAHKNTKHTNR